jgi:hypothetical protein
MFGTGLGEKAFHRRLVVSIDRRIDPADYANWLVLAHLAANLGCERLLAGIAVRRVQPNAKPMLELFDPAGCARGYAKLGWSAATRQLVRTEADALLALHGRLHGIIIPDLATRGVFADTEYSVATPLPLGLRPWTTDPIDAPDVALEVAHAAEVYKGPLKDSAHAKCLREQLIAAEGTTPHASRVLLHWLARLEENPTELQFGRWHGDWTPHNLGSLDGRVVAWDWEHSKVDVPIGFDALHWHHQRALPRGGLVAAVADVLATSDRLGSLGVPPEARRLTASLYLLGLYLRTVTLAIGGGGWNSRVYPAMLDVADNMDRN